MSFASSATHRTATATKTRINSGKENTSSSKTTSATSSAASSKPKPKQSTSTSTTSSTSTTTSTKPHSSLSKTQTRPTAPLASLPFSQRRQNPTSTSTTASAPPIRSSISAKPRVVAQSKQISSTQIQRPAPSTTQNPVRNNQAPARKPVSVAARSQIQDDSFGTVNLDDILGADSTKDLDSRNSALKSSNPSATSRPVAGAGRRNTTFAGSQSRALQEDGESVRKRASIYAGPVRVIKKNPNATVPIMHQQPDESMTNYRESLSMSSRPAQRVVDDYSTSSQTSQHLQGPQRHQQHQSINNYSNEAPFPQLASRPTFNAAAAGLVPLPPTPLKPPQRVPITNNNAMNHHPQPQTNSSTQNSLPQPTPTPQDLSSTLLTEAVASTSLYRTSSATSTSAPQILHTPRRVLEQTKARSIGMAVMDMLATPGRAQQTPGRGQLRASASGTGGGGNLMHRFQEVIEDDGGIGGPDMKSANNTGTCSISDVTVESVKTDVMTTPPRYAPPVVVESPRSAGKTKLPVFGGAGVVGRGLLPDPFEVLGITVDSSKSAYVGAGIPDVFASMREESREDVEANVWKEPKDVVIGEMTDLGEKGGDEVVAVTHEASVGRVEVVDSIATNASSANANTSCNVDVVWKQVSPRREGLVGDGGEYRGGIRADPVECSAANTSVTGKKREDLSELEQRFRGITSQLMARVHTETTEVEPLAKAAEPTSVQLEPQPDPEPSASLKNMSEAASIPPGDVKPWQLQMPDLGEMDQEKIKFEIDTLDEEEKQLMREIMKLEGKFS